jgi:hypothetical protein
MALNPNGKGINSNFVPPNTLFKGIPKELHSHTNLLPLASYFGKAGFPFINYTNSLSDINSSKKQSQNTGFSRTFSSINNNIPKNHPPNST